MGRILSCVRSLRVSLSTWSTSSSCWLRRSAATWPGWASPPSSSSLAAQISSGREISLCCFFKEKYCTVQYMQCHKVSGVDPNRFFGSGSSIFGSIWIRILIHSFVNNVEKKVLKKLQRKTFSLKQIFCFKQNENYDRKKFFCRLSL